MELFVPLERIIQTVASRISVVLTTGVSSLLFGRHGGFSNIWGLVEKRKKPSIKCFIVRAAGISIQPLEFERTYFRRVTGYLVSVCFLATY